MEEVNRFEFSWKICKEVLGLPMKIWVITFYIAIVKAEIIIFNANFQKVLVMRYGVTETTANTMLSLGGLLTFFILPFFSYIAIIGGNTVTALFTVAGTILHEIGLIFLFILPFYFKFTDVLYFFLCLFFCFFCVYLFCIIWCHINKTQQCCDFAQCQKKNTKNCCCLLSLLFFCVKIKTIQAIQHQAVWICMVVIPIGNIGYFVGSFCSQSMNTPNYLSPLMATVTMILCDLASGIFNLIFGILEDQTNSNWGDSMILMIVLGGVAVNLSLLRYYFDWKAEKTHIQIIEPV